MLVSIFYFFPVFSLSSLACSCTPLLLRSPFLPFPPTQTNPGQSPPAAELLPARDSRAAGAGEFLPMSRWLLPGSRGGAGGRERERERGRDPTDGRAAGIKSPLRSSRGQGQIHWTRQSGATDDSKASYNQENMPKTASFRASGLPIKALGEDDTSKQAADKRSKSPSVFARLMGLDKPSPERQQSVSSQKGGFFEPPRASKLDSSSHRELSQHVDGGSSKQKRYDGEVKLAATQIPTRENHLPVIHANSHRTRETGGNSDSTKDFIMRLVQGRTPFFNKQYSREDSNSCLPSTAKPTHITILRPPSKGGKVKSELSTTKDLHGKGGKGIQTNAQVPRSNVVGNYAKEPILLPEHKFRKLKVIKKHDPSIHPAHIVVLKPNLKNLQDKEKVLSPYRYVDNNLHEMQRGQSASGIDVMFDDDPDKSSHDVSPWKIPSAVYGGIASTKDDKMLMGSSDNYYDGLSYFHNSESTQSESDLSYMDELKKTHQMPHSSKSSFNRQAKKFSSEQWMMTSHKAQEDDGLLGQGANALGNILAAQYLDVTNRNVLGVEGHMRSVLPGVMSKDGDDRKRMCSWSTDDATVHSDPSRNRPPRRRSLSMPSSASESTSLQISYINGEKYAHRKRLDFSDISLPGEINSKRQVTELPILGGSVATTEQFKKVFLPENKSVNYKHSTGAIKSAATLENDALRYDSKARENTGSADITGRKPELSIATKESAPIHCLPNLSRLSSNSRKPNLVIKLEDPDNNSPVSVLESAEEKEPTTPECFSGLNDDLNELRLQLDLLRLETPKSKIQGPPLVCDESNLEDDCVLLQEEDELQFCTEEEERDFSYLLGILTDSHLGGIAMDMIFNACYCLENPVDPNVFEKLEKVFDEPEVWSRAERKLLFDLVNSVLSEELAPNIDLHPWVQPCRIAGLVKRRKLVAEDIWKSLIRKKKELEVRPAKPILEVSWIDVRDDMDMIGRDIEKMLRDELLDEIVLELIAV